MPRCDKAIFCVRDPLSLYVSAFHSRLRKGQPKFYFEWSPAEAAAFERFPTPQALAEGLGSDDEETLKAAQQAMKAIQHIRGIRRFLQSPEHVMEHRKQIAYIGHQETLDDDWQRIRALLELPEDIELPSDPKKSHRSQPSAVPALDANAEAILRRLRARLRDHRRLRPAARRARLERRAAAPQARAQDRARRLRQYAPQRRPTRAGPARTQAAHERHARGESTSVHFDELRRVVAVPVKASGATRRSSRRRRRSRAEVWSTSSQHAIASPPARTPIVDGEDVEASGGGARGAESQDDEQRGRPIHRAAARPPGPGREPRAATR